MSAETLLTLPQAAEYLGLSTAHLYRLRSENRPPVSHKRHGKVYYYEADLDTHIARSISATTRGNVQ
jgi:predicted DNA-binding transcriptional regulator AlpA